MRVRFSSKGNVAAGAFKLTEQEIEQQVLTDLSKYRTRFQERYHAPAPSPLDVESLVKELWDVVVSYEDIPQSESEEVLGYFAPEIRTIVVDPRICNHPRRISFTVAHEAGHLSLHAFLFTQSAQSARSGTARATRRKMKTNPSIEWQANTYAAQLLAPKREVVAFLEEQGLAAANVIPRAIDVEQILMPFQERFGLSRHAMEVHLHRLGISMVNTQHALRIK